MGVHASPSIFHRAVPDQILGSAASLIRRSTTRQGLVFLHVASSSPLTLTADSHMKFTGDEKWLEICGHASVLIYIRKSSWTDDDCTVIMKRLCTYNETLFDNILKK